MYSFFLFRAVLLVAIIIIAMTTNPLVAQTIGYGHRSGEIVELRLDSGSGDISWQVRSETDLQGISGALALSPDGLLFATNYLWPIPDRLVTLDPATGELHTIGEIPFSLWTDLTFDDQQQLWMTKGSELFLVDQLDATPTLVPIVPTDLRAVAFHRGTLYGIASEDFFTFLLVEIDPLSGTRIPLVELEGFSSGGCLAEEPISMAFDSFGGLWVVVAEWSGTCIIPTVSTSYNFYPTPDTGALGSRRQLAEELYPFLPGLAVAGGSGAVEIPTLDHIGMIVLALSVLALGIGVSRRSTRRSFTPSSD